MTVVGCSFALTGSQIVPLLYLTLGTTIALDLNAPSLTIWVLTAIIVAVGALAPFVGPLADLFGRKTLLLVGLVLSIAGSIVCAATPTAEGFIAGQCLLGFGAVTQELLAIAIVSEIVPTAKRSLYFALVLCTIIPWSPSSLYANWMADSSWRWIGCTVAIWNVLTLSIIAFFYRPPPRVNALGLSRRELIGRIDFVGGALITTGLVFFLISLNWGGQVYPWQSAHVLSFLIIGICLMIGFGLWEWFGARYPLFPRRMVYAPRPFFCMLFVIFAAGINFVPLVVFWPIESISVFGSGHHQTGVNTLPIGTCILGGAILSALLIGLFKRHVTLVMTIFCVMQTAGESPSSSI
jgi:MFS family permease